MIRTCTILALVVAAVILVSVVGCGRPEASPQGVATEPGPGAAVPKKRAGGPDSSEKKQGDEHGHKPGAHGGIIVEIGRDSYHAEAIFEKNGALRLYMLGKDEARVQEVETQTLTAYAKPEGDTEAQSFELKAAPQPGDAQGKTSLFLGQLPKELWGQKVEVTIQNIRIAGERFRVGFPSAGEKHGDDPMPDKVAGEDEEKLYLTPGGKYTAADIKANGNMTASKKFKGVMAKHDMHPKPGDKICPITETKASPKFTWFVDGKPYEFCCPPCVDEFVKNAKEHPEQVKEPGEYLKK